MQRQEFISRQSLEKIVDAVYDGDPNVFEAYSDYDCEIKSFPNKESLITDISTELSKDNRHKSVYYFLIYPGSGGIIKKRKIDLDPKRSDGATYRYTAEGWGLIQFQLDLTNTEKISCRFAVNSEKRANKWSSTYPEFESPSLWNWVTVEKHARRLIRALRKQKS